MEHIGKMAVSSDAMIGGVEGASESRAGAVGLHVTVAADIVVVGELGVEVGTVEQEFGHRELLILVGYTATFCSCLGRVQGMVLGRDVLVGTLGNRPETGEVVHSCRIVARCQSSSFPCHRAGSSGQR